MIPLSLSRSWCYQSPRSVISKPYLLTHLLLWWTKTNTYLSPAKKKTKHKTPTQNFSLIKLVRHADACTIKRFFKVHQSPRCQRRRNRCWFLCRRDWSLELEPQWPKIEAGRIKKKNGESEQSVSDFKHKRLCNNRKFGEKGNISRTITHTQTHTVYRLQ